MKVIGTVMLLVSEKLYYILYKNKILCFIKLLKKCEISLYMSGSIQNPIIVIFSEVIYCFICIISYYSDDLFANLKMNINLI